ncbi:MAG: COX15/CtaA family protein [Alphaproteobacteria bacterium]|nr:COX15/CtaA family protein [Alphaproteobacteria bacterium]
MIVVGGATRLTDSGLSITEWLPLLGVIPPLSDADWQTAFEKYKQIPEYQLVNKGMSLAQFQFIYWWEWSHRFLGRFIGVAFAIPLFFFWITNRIPKGYLAKLLAILALGGLQGFFGWYMVQSGLSERVDVSHYRLALHLTTAFVILAAVLWVAFDLDRDQQHIRLHTLTASQSWTATLLVALLFAQVVIGAFVAGLKAGLAFNTWPLMDGTFIPPDILTMTPFYLNFVENVATVQFTHRLLAYVLIALAIWHTFSLSRTADDERVVTSAALLSLAFIIQAAIGIWTLIAAGQNAEIPIGLGLLHQGGAAIVLSVAVWHAHRMHRAAH